MAKKVLAPAYKTDNQAFGRDDPPDLQESGVVLWCAEAPEGWKFYGKTQAEAEKARSDFMRIK